MQETGKRSHGKLDKVETRNYANHKKRGTRMAHVVEPWGYLPHPTFLKQFTLFI
jgi:hypothetical protein